ncbi:hypothetical protein ACFL4A_00575 [bacterium]
MSMNNITIKSNIRNYDVSFDVNENFIDEIIKENKNNIVIIDENVYKCHSKNALSVFENLNVIILPISEEVKNINTVLELFDKIIKKMPNKKTTIISIGGGITQDITGFLASTLFRGVKWVYVPTTLLAQDDSCIGAKTSLNFKQYKNLIGTFYPPTSVHIYTPFLKTLEDVDYLSGVGESAKLHMMGGKESINFFVDNIDAINGRDENVLLDMIKKCLAIKKAYIEDDEFDQGKRNMLNFGHCFGHAIESATDFVVPHGQAVAIGIILANYAAVKRGILNTELANSFNNKVLLPVIDKNLLKVKIDSQEVISAMKRDKKRVTKDFALVMIDNNYEMVRIDDLKETEIVDALEDYKNKYSN